MGVRLVRYNHGMNPGSGGSGSGGMASDHDELINKDLMNQHPIYAITGLQEVLNLLEDTDYELSKLLTAFVDETNKRIQEVLDMVAVIDTYFTKEELTEVLLDYPTWKQADNKYAAIAHLADAIDFRFVPAVLQANKTLGAIETIRSYFYKYDISGMYAFSATAGWTTGGNGTGWQKAGTYTGEANVLCDIYTKSGKRVAYIKIGSQTSGGGSWTSMFNTETVFLNTGQKIAGKIAKVQTWYGGTDGGRYEHFAITCPKMTDFQTYFGEPCYAIIKGNGAPTMTVTPIVCDHHEVTIEERDLEANLRQKLVSAHSHANKDFLDKLSIADNQIYYDGQFVEVPLSQEENNGIVLKPDGYWSEQFNISAEAGNYLEKLPDGYYITDRGNAHIVTQAQHGLSVGEFIYYHHDKGYQKALAIDDLSINVIGIVSRVFDTDTFEYRWTGFFATDIFTEANGYTQGMPLYLAETTPGGVVQIQPDMSKAVGYPVENLGLIISIERGVEYNRSIALGDFKISANAYNVRSDGYIRIAEGIDYKLTFVEDLLAILSDEFKAQHILVTDNVVQFINTATLYAQKHVPEGLNLFIRAFDIDASGTGSFEELKAQNALLRQEISELSRVFDILNREVIE